MYEYIRPAQKHMQESVAIKATAPPRNAAQMCLSFHGTLRGPLWAEAGRDGKHCSKFTHPNEKRPTADCLQRSRARRLV